MKKLLLMLFALLTTAGAWAESYTITFDTTTGTFYNGSNAAVTSGWIAKWVSNEAGKPAVTLTVSANNVNAANGRFAPGSSQSSTYSLSVEDGYKITGFALNCPTFGAEVTVTPNGEAAVVAATGENIVVNSNATSFVYSGSNSGRIQAASSDGGSFTIFVEDIPAEKVAAYNTAKGWINAIQSANGLVKDATKYISNAKSSAEGSYEALLDGEYTTYFHGAYGNEGPDEDQYLQAELTEAVDAIHFYYKKRSQNNNNRPTSITISGSNDGTTFTEITTINSGLPTNAAVIEYASDKISLGASYKYVRFTVTATNNNAQNGTGHVFFTFSEFYIMPANEDIDAAVSIYNTLPANADALTDAQVTQINEINTALTSTTVNVTYELYESDGTTLVSSVTTVQNKNSEVAIPSSLTGYTYYDYTTEGTIGTTDCTIKVVRTLKSSVVYPITKLSNNKAYTLTTVRGSLGTNGTQMVSTFGTSYTTGNFAIISYEDKYYLYSVADSKFVGNPQTINNVANQPILTDDLSNVTPISFTETTLPYYYAGMGSNGVNVSSYATGIVVNSWTTHDPGNQYIIEEAADFDPTEALAALEEYFHPSITVTYVVKDGDNNVLFTSEPQGTTMGANITSLPAEYQLTNFYDYNTVDVTISETNTTIEFTATLKENPNFKFTADTTEPIWYKLKIKDANYPTYVADGTPNVTLPTTDANDETVQWAFIGNPYAGFQIINRAAGTSLVLGSASAASGGNNGGNTYVTLAAPGTQTYEKFYAYHSGLLTNGFFLFNEEGYAMNQRSTANLAYWTGGYDLGSTFVATEIHEGEMLYYDLIAQLEAINFGTEPGQYNLTVEGTDYTAQVATIISGMKTQGYSDENLAMVQLMLEGVSLNMPGAGYYRIKGKTSGMYLAAGLASNNKFAMSTATDASTIFYFDGNTLVNFGSGMSNGMTASAWAWVTGDAASAVVFQDGLTNGGYAIKSATANFYDNGDGTASADRGGNVPINASTNTRYTSWALEKVSTLPLSLNAVGSDYYATLCVPYDVTLDGAEAYTLTVNADKTELDLGEALTTVPAGTPVMLKGTAATATATLGTDYVNVPVASTLTGVFYATTVAAETDYFLGQKDGEVGFYKWTGTTLKANRAYLPASAVAAEVKGLKLNFGDTDAIEAIENGQLTTGNEAIYNLAGQRVSKATRGIYVKNGRKVVIK